MLFLCILCDAGGGDAAGNQYLSEGIAARHLTVRPKGNRRKFSSTCAESGESWANHEDRSMIARTERITRPVPSMITFSKNLIAVLCHYGNLRVEYRNVGDALTSMNRRIGYQTV